MLKDQLLWQVGLVAVPCVAQRYLSSLADHVQHDLCTSQAGLSQRYKQLGLHRAQQQCIANLKVVIGAAWWGLALMQRQLACTSFCKTATMLLDDVISHHCGP